MCLWKRNCRYLVLVFVLLVIPTVSAQNVSLDYPSQVYIGEEFEFEIELIDFTESIYDVKIDITANNNNRIAQILDSNSDKYKSTYYFVNDIEFNDNISILTLNITEEYEGRADIIVRIRKSGVSSESFDGYEINIEKKVEEVVEGVIEEPEITEEVEEEIVEENKESNKKIIELSNKNETLKITKLSNEREVVNLVPKNIKNIESKDIVFKSKNEKIKIFALYAFTLFCVFIITLLIYERRR